MLQRTLNPQLSTVSNHSNMGGGGNDYDDELVEQESLLSGSSSVDTNSLIASNPKNHPRVYPQRWVQLGYLSLLALLSDWVCFSLAAAPEAFEEYYYEDTTQSSASLIDLFLFVNVASSFFVTDVVAHFGMKHTIRLSSVLMCVGCWFRSGGLFVMFETGEKEGLLVSYESIVIGTVLVGAAQPFVQCTPPLLSAQWFASSERATSTAIALNFNQVGIATAFLVGAYMATSVEGLARYFFVMAVISTVLMVGVFWHFEERPEIPPSSSEFAKRNNNSQTQSNGSSGGNRQSHNHHAHIPFRLSVMKFFSTPGFTRPLVAFICSISITNVIGAFIDKILRRVGIVNKLHVALAGAGFEFTIVLGGILLGGYVDRTKEYKRVTLWCLAISLFLLIPLGWTAHAFGTMPPIIVVVALLGLGFVTGPIQPINAELAVDVTYPGDETAVESVQQIGGNLVSALLVPLAERAAKREFELLPHIALLANDIRGDVVLLLCVTVLTLLYFRGFSAPLRRSMADRRDEAMRDDGVELSDVNNGEEVGSLLVV